MRLADLVRQCGLTLRVIPASIKRFPAGRGWDEGSLSRMQRPADTGGPPAGSVGRLIVHGAVVTIGVAAGFEGDKEGNAAPGMPEMGQAGFRVQVLAAPPRPHVPHEGGEDAGIGDALLPIPGGVFPGAEVEYRRDAGQP